MAGLGIITVRFTDRFRAHGGDWDSQKGRRGAFWSTLRAYLREERRLKDIRPGKDAGASLPESDDQCEERLRANFDIRLNYWFSQIGRAERTRPLRPVLTHLVTVIARPTVQDIYAWRGAQLQLTSIRYRSLSLGLIVAGTKSFLDIVEKYPDVFESFVEEFAGTAFDESLKVPVSEFVRTTVEYRAGVLDGNRHGKATSVATVLARQLGLLLPLLAALGVPFVVAYNGYTDAKAERSEVAVREGKLIDRQQKMLEMQSARIAGLEGRLSVALSTKGYAAHSTSQVAPQPAQPTKP